MTTSQLQAIREREEHLLCRTYGRYPLAISSASGSTLYDTSGRAYTDLLAGIAVCNLGHCHPELTRVLAEQAEKLVHVSNLFYQQEQLDLAEKLLSTCAADKVFFCNSGAEANEAAIKLARRYMRTVLERDAYQILTLEGSFHGRTLATLTATG
ncbi:MAG: aminotransferase class III-fold pyridoxal phosphate-dependent enzyme, partial [Desulfohalobiaceae bacterium]